MPPPSDKPSLQAAIAAHRAGRRPEAIALYHAVLKADPASYDALHMLGVALFETGKTDEGLEYLERATRLSPGIKAGWISLGKAGQAAKKPDIVAKAFHAAWKLDNRDMAAAREAIRGLNILGRGGEALALIAEAERAGFRSAELDNEQGKALALLGKYREAAAMHESASQSPAGPPDASLFLGRALAMAGELDRAEAVLTAHLATAPQHVPAILSLSSVLRQLGKTSEAMARAESAIKAAPQNARAKVMLGLCLTDAGRSAEAEVIYREVLRGAPSGPAAVEALQGLAQIHTFTAADTESQLVASLLATPHLAPAERRSLSFVKAKIEDDLGHVGAAIAAATAAHVGTLDPRRFSAYVGYARNVAKHLDRDFFATRSDGGHASEEPVFIVGMPRSGTSLVEQIIAAHPQAAGAGELQALPALANSLARDDDTPQSFAARVAALDTTTRAGMAETYLAQLRRAAPDALRITDKLPHNFQNLWLADLLFPKARVVYCKRNPVDVCVSIYLHDFSHGHWYADDLETLGAYHRFHEELTAHWKMATGLAWHDNVYEDLVADPEPQIRRLIDFLGLPWDDRCLRHAEVKRPVATFSSQQVRKPIYTSSVERWRKYAPYIKPLLRGLGLPEG